MRSVNFWHQQDSKHWSRDLLVQVAYSVLKNRKKLAAVVFHSVAVVKKHDIFQTLLLQNFFLKILIVSRTRSPSWAPGRTQETSI